MSDNSFRILVVDDEPLVLRAFRHILESRGLEVDTASTCREVDGLAVCDAYDLVLVDFQLPDGDGIGLMERLSSRKAARAYIVMSGHLLSEKELLPLACGCSCGLLKKPVDAADLLQAVDWVLEGRGLNGVA